MADAAQGESVVDIPTDAPKEPARTTGAIVAGATLLINGLVLFGILTLSSDQKLYLVTATGFLAPLVAGLWIRGKVFSPATVDKLISNFRKAADDSATALSQAKSETAATKAAIQAVQAVIPQVVQALNVPQSPDQGPPDGSAGPPPLGQLGRSQPARSADTRELPQVPAQQPPPRPPSVGSAQPEGYYDYPDRSADPDRYGALRRAPTPPPSSAPEPTVPRGYRRRHRRNEA